MAERATRQMLDGIAAFRDAYRTNPKFKTILGDLDKVEQEAERLVPAAYDRTPDDADEQPKTLREAGKQATRKLRQANADAEDAKDGGKDESTERS